MTKEKHVYRRALSGVLIFFLAAALILDESIRAIMTYSLWSSHALQWLVAVLLGLPSGLAFGVLGSLGVVRIVRLVYRKSSPGDSERT